MKTGNTDMDCCGAYLLGRSEYGRSFRKINEETVKENIEEIMGKKFNFWGGHAIVYVVCSALLLEAGR